MGDRLFPRQGKPRPIPETVAAGETVAQVGRWRESPMIEARRQQLHFGDGLIAEEVSDLQEDWMKHADQALEDEQLGLDGI